MRVLSSFVFILSEVRLIDANQLAAVLLLSVPFLLLTTDQSTFLSMNLHRKLDAFCYSCRYGSAEV